MLPGPADGRAGDRGQSARGRARSRRTPGGGIRRRGEFRVGAVGGPSSPPCRPRCRITRPDDTGGGAGVRRPRRRPRARSLCRCPKSEAEAGRDAFGRRRSTMPSRCSSGRRIPRRAAHSFNPAPPSWTEHLRWRRRRLADPRLLSRVVLLADRPAGTVRLDRRAVAGCPDGYEVSIAIAPACRGLGIGKAALFLAGQLVPHLPLVARIKPENEASRRLFAVCGYRPFAAGVFVRWPDGYGPDVPGQETATGNQS